MIRNPLIIILILVAIEAVVLVVSSSTRCKKYFQFIPSVFWIYFLPMLASSLKLIDSQSPIYQTIIIRLLPVSLLLLLVPVDVKAIARLGRPALMMFFAGGIGIVIGAPLVFALFKPWVGSEMWSGFGALAGSWTGGSANMVAVKEAIGTPDSVFLPMVIVDTVVPYIWMGILVASAGWQVFYDRWNRSDRRVLDDLGGRVTGIASAKAESFTWNANFGIAILGLLGAGICSWLAGFLPVIQDVISTYAWTIILVSILGITLSLTPARRLERYGISRLGYFILYFVLTAIGAKASLNNLGSSLVLISAGCLLVVIHAIVLVITARLIKAPMFLVAAASQANIGGVASAPVVAEIYHPGLASVGLLLAILGNIIGTYFGIIAGQLCRYVSGV